MAATIGSAQSFYPRNYFVAPMDTPLLLSAPFGSLRENHFHSGMDIRTYEKEGLPVYAVADGYISRIKYASNGYGKAIYINHPNGYTSVYGHLQRAEGEIATYIKKYQYEVERFDFDHFPGVDRIKVAKGQIIGWSGNSGGSTGPHLHFEIRDTKTEEVINPQLFGIYGVDVHKPLIKKVAVYSLDGNRPALLTTVDVVSKNIRVGPDSIPTCIDTLKLSSTTIGFGAEAYDYLTNMTSEYSIYRLSVLLDATKIYEHTLDRFSFDDSRCINVHIDYAFYKESKTRIQKCFRDDGNRIAIYNYLRNKGKILLPRDSSIHEVVLTAYDIDGRSASVRVLFRYSPPAVNTVVKQVPNVVAVLYPSKNNTYRTSVVDINIPPKALYDTLLFTYRTTPSEKFSYSAIHSIHDPNTPLNSAISVSLKIEAAPEILRDKLLLASVNSNGSISAIGGGYDTDKIGWVTARTSSFANACIVADSVAPSVKILNAGKDGVVKDSVGMFLKIEDTLSGIASYKITLNGRWILTDYDAKNDLLLYLFDEKTVFNQKQEAVITVSDKKGNTTVVKKEITFVR
jgi:hypothetical protein